MGSVNGVRKYESFLTTLSDNGLPPESLDLEAVWSMVCGQVDSCGWASRDRITIIAPDGSDRVLRSQDLLFSEMEDPGLEISVMRLIDNNVWIGTNRGISVVGTAELSLTGSYQQQLPNAQVTDIVAHEPTNTIWVATLGGGIAYLKPDGTWPRVNQLNNLRSDTVHALAVSNTTVYAATQNGPSAINPNSGAVDDFFNFGNDLAEQNAAALDIYFDQGANRLIVATNNGLAVRTNNSWEKFQRINGGLPFNSDTEVVRAVSYDGEYMWMVMRRGDSDFPNGTIVRRRPALADTTGILQWTPGEIGVPAIDSADGVRLNIRNGEIILSTCGRSGLVKCLVGYLYCQVVILNCSDLVVTVWWVQSLPKAG